MIIMVLRAHVLILYVRGALEGAHIRVYIGVCVCASECLHVAHVRARVCVCACRGMHVGAIMRLHAHVCTCVVCICMGGHALGALVGRASKRADVRVCMRACAFIHVPLI